jgi:tyrosinase
MRHNINALTPQQVESLRNGVAAMKARPAADPTSWTFQAAIHWVNGVPTNPLHRQCQHGTVHFLTWHRGYVYFFERILRAASGDPELTLPYWNWTDQPALPEVYRIPGDATNPLYDNTRFINDGSTLPSPVVSDDLDTALALTDFWPPASFSSSLEGSPHGSVHVLTGVNMGSFATAALDPIFWLHHCNIDRNWDRWLNQGGGRVDPSDSAFLNQTFSYADETGATITLRVSDMLYSSQLGYRYDDTPNPPGAATAALAAAGGGRRGVEPPEPRVVASSAAGAQAVQAEAKTLGFRAETVTLGFVPEGQPALRAAADAAKPDQPGKILVRISDLRFAAPPAFTYEVLLNAPEGDITAEAARRHHVGTVNFFSGHGADHGHEDGGTRNQTFDATRTVARLGEAGLWKDEPLRVTLRPITAEPPEGREAEARRRAEESAAKAEISYGKIDLLVVE